MSVDPENIPDDFPETFAGHSLLEVSLGADQAVVNTWSNVMKEHEGTQDSDLIPGVTDNEPPGAFTPGSSVVYPTSGTEKKMYEGTGPHDFGTSDLTIDEITTPKIVFNDAGTSYLEYNSGTSQVNLYINSNLISRWSI